MAHRDLHKMLLGEILVSNESITNQQLETALEAFKRSDKLLGEVLIDLGFVTEEMLLKALSQQLDVPVIELSDYPVDLSKLNLVSEEWAAKFNVLILGEDQGKLLAAMSDPLDFDTQDTLRLFSGKEIKVFSAPKDLLKKAILNSYSELRKESDSEISVESLDQTESGIAGLLNSILKQALHRNATDIHVEPSKNATRVRIRVDGVLKEIMTLEVDISKKLIETIKETPAMKSLKTQFPQYSRVEIAVDRHLLDARISILPTYSGETAVMRIMNQDQPVLLLQQLGFSEKDEQQLRNSILNAGGMVLVTGPRGSGTTTTLYAFLHSLNKTDKSIITVESPVEYQIEGISQVQTDEYSEMGLKEMIRSIGYQDPDIIMIGDLNNRECAELAVQEATAGRLVLCAMSGSSIRSCIANLVDFGIPVNQLSLALRACIAQRLVKKICPHCKASYLAGEEEASLLGVPKESVVYHGEGCIRCAYSGYLGRTAVIELLPVDEDIRKTIKAGTAEYEETESFKEKCKGLVLSGTTSVEEFSRIILTLNQNQH